MPLSCCPLAAASAVDAANARLRAFCRGRSVWTPEALQELAQLRGEWLRAREAEQVQREMVRAA